jgi:hypothetical protein
MTKEINKEGYKANVLEEYLQAQLAGNLGIFPKTNR